MMTDNNEDIIFKSRKYRWRYRPSDLSLMGEASLQLGFPRPIAEIMAKKGFRDKAAVESFFTLPLSSLRDPFEMTDMDKAARRLAQAVEEKEKICIYGDYDVDGVTSTASLFLFLKQTGSHVVYYIPHRLEEGYGLNKDALYDIAAAGVKLLVTVDCGISAAKEVEEAADMGMDVIVTDHHQLASNLPNAAYAIVNPMREAEDNPSRCLSGVGVAFKLIMALRYVLREKGYFKGDPPNIKNFLDIVTLGTVADVVPLVDENRVIVKRGLDIMSGKRIRTGIEELKNVTGLGEKPLKTYHVGFQLAPRINAVGRMGSSDKSLRLLITDNREEAKLLALELDNENKFRQATERDILKEAFGIIEEKNLGSRRGGIVLAGERWHPGVIGIVASRVADKYFRPTVILSCDGEVSKGSARSIPAFHLYDGLEVISDILLSFGGHKYAAGVKIATDKIEEFSRRFDKAVNSALNEEDFTPEIQIDALLEASDVTDNLMTWLNKLEPYGAGNKEPVFCIRNVKKYKPPAFVGKDESHMKCFFEKNGTIFDSIGYNMKDSREVMSENEEFDIAFSLVINKWRGTESIQLNLKDVKKAGLPDGKL